MWDGKKRLMHPWQLNEMTEGVRTDEHPTDKFAQHRRLLQVALKKFAKQFGDEQDDTELGKQVSRPFHQLH
jgi:hypothetical protein